MKETVMKETVMKETGTIEMMVKKTPSKIGFTCP